MVTGFTRHAKIKTIHWRSASRSDFDELGRKCDIIQVGRDSKHFNKT